MNKFQILKPKNTAFSETKGQREEGQIKIKISKVALSRNDLDLYDGIDNVSYPIVPAHAGVGFVSEADEKSGYKMGARVAINPFVDETVLEVINDRSPIISMMGVGRDGLLQDFVIIPEENVFSLPEGILDNEALFVDYISTGINVFENYDFKKGDVVAIIGSGIMQNILGQIAIYYQLIPVLIDVNSDSLKELSNYGIYYTIDASKEDMKQRMNELTGGRMAEFSIFLPKENSFDDAIEMTRNGGTIIVAGYTAKNKYDANLMKVMEKQLKIVAINNGAEEMETSINLLANKIIKTDGLIDATVKFENVDKLFEEWTKKPEKYRKVLVEID